MTVERVDDAGRWVDGMLVDPAPGWLDGIAEAPEAPPMDDTVTVTRGDLATMMRSLRDEIVAELSPSSVNTIGETKAGIIAAVSDVADGIGGVP